MGNRKKREGNFPVSIVRAAVLLAAVAFLMVGILQREYLEVLQKAARICLECIGIG